jgi:hypothetical protein
MYHIPSRSIIANYVAIVANHVVDLITPENNLAIHVAIIHVVTSHYHRPTMPDYSL